MSTMERGNGTRNNAAGCFSAASLRALYFGGILPLLALRSLKRYLVAHLELSEGYALDAIGMEENSFFDTHHFDES